MSRLQLDRFLANTSGFQHYRSHESESRADRSKPVRISLPAGPCVLRAIGGSRVLVRGLGSKIKHNGPNQVGILYAAGRRASSAVFGMRRIESANNTADTPRSTRT